MKAMSKLFQELQMRQVASRALFGTVSIIAVALDAASKMSLHGPKT
jgi:hypothetical protein